MKEKSRLPLATCTTIAIALLLSSSAPGTTTPTITSLDVQVPAAPLPVTIGGRVHLAYELHITNFARVDVELQRIDVLGGRNETPLASFQDQELAAGLARVGSRPDPSDKRLIKPGTRVVFFLWLAPPANSALPSVLRHRVTFQVLTPAAEQSSSVEGAPIGVGHEKPIVLSPPLLGGPWVAAYDPASIWGHRRAIFAINGKARIPARFAIDWIKVGDDGLVSPGNSSEITKSYGYGAEVLAVTDATVVDLRDGIPEPTPTISLENAGGNYVTLDLGAGRFAFYEHLKTGSIRVKIGTRVKSGDVLALLGGSGSVSSGAHLHFHVADANSPLGAEGLPFVFRSFERIGAFESLGAVGSGKPFKPLPAQEISKRTMEMPAGQTVLKF